MGPAGGSRPSVAELAAAVGGEARGDSSLVLSRASSLEDAGPGDLSFLHRPDQLERARASRAGCVLVDSEGALPGRTVIVVDEPRRAFARAIPLLHPPSVPEPGVASSAVVHATARLDTGVSVGPAAVIGAGSRIGARSVVGASVVVGADVAVGADCLLHPGAVLLDGTRLGDRVIVHANAVLGADGFGYASGPDGHLKVPHVGVVVVEDDVEIGAGSCVDRAVTGQTRIGAGTKIDNLVQVGHNVDIGPGCLLVAQSGVSGSSRLGAGCVLAGQSGVAGHLDLGPGVRVAAKSAVLQDVDAGGTVGGIPAVALGSWKRTVAALRRLPELLRRVRRLEDEARGRAERGRDQ